jgi:hypothetical protein
MLLAIDAKTRFVFLKETIKEPLSLVAPNGAEEFDSVAYGVDVMGAHCLSIH